MTRVFFSFFKFFKNKNPSDHRYSHPPGALRNRKNLVEQSRCKRLLPFLRLFSCCLLRDSFYIILQCRYCAFWETAKAQTKALPPEGPPIYLRARVFLKLWKNSCKTQGICCNTFPTISNVLKLCMFIRTRMHTATGYQKNTTLHPISEYWLNFICRPSVQTLEIFRDIVIQRGIRTRTKHNPIEHPVENIQILDDVKAMMRRPRKMRPAKNEKDRIRLEKRRHERDGK